MTEHPMPITASAGEPVHVTVEGATDRDRDRRWGTIVVAWILPLLTAVLSTVLCLSVSARNAERGRAARAELQRTQCAIVITLDENYRAVPATTPTGVRNAASMAQLRQSLGCEPHQG